MESCRALTLVSLAVAAAMASIAHAETYKWVDPQGRVQYTDRLPTEAVNRGNVELSRQGIARKVTDAPLTAEQKRAVEERLAREREADKITREKLQQENALLSSYTSEDDIEISRHRTLALIGAAIISAEPSTDALSTAMTS